MLLTAAQDKEDVSPLFVKWVETEKNVLRM